MNKMSIPEADKILNYNVLNLNNAGLDYFPVKFVKIDSFIIGEEKNPNHPPMAEILAMLEKSDSNDEKFYHPEADYYCSCFMINDGHSYYYRDFFHEAMDVIKALRIKNGYDSKRWEEFWQ